MKSGSVLIFTRTLRVPKNVRVKKICSSTGRDHGGDFKEIVYVIVLVNIYSNMSGTCLGGLMLSFADGNK